MPRASIPFRRIRALSYEIAHPNGRRPPFKFSALTRVAFSDTDAQGIVYYGRYLPYFDLARVEYHRHLGLLDADAGEAAFVMRASSLEYLAPARFDDLIEVFIRIARIGRTSMTYECSAYRVEDDRLMVSAKQTLVRIDGEERSAVEVEPVFRERVRAFEGDDLEL